MFREHCFILTENAKPLKKTTKTKSKKLNKVRDVQAIKSKTKSTRSFVDVLKKGSLGKQ